MKTKHHKNTNWQSLLTLTVIGLGSLLLVIKMYADSEPGAIPLLLILGGTSGYIMNRVRMRAQS